MSGAEASMAVDRPVRVGGLADAIVLRALVPMATMLVIGAVSLLLLFTPLYLHTALDASQAAGWLGATPAQAHDYSDRTVSDLLFGPATFDFAAADGTPFYTADERGHMRDVRVVLYGFLGLSVLALLALVAVAIRRRGDREFIRSVRRGGAVLVVGTIVLGVLAFFAFDAMFELFHRLLFPGGNFSFDPTTQRLVQLYPLAFWQITSAALGFLLVMGGSAAWLIGRRA